ncbi:Hypp7543 [Branchiostoma lanceolatum]|uniref:Hypp7543 protein n=1 Tax=Branchiostoma lanceolatum TaxID=7740 RepID=A0A8J9Z266_BRALA|nr:Hypp7543 [Branchiostoma lanceolatum]
MMAAASDHASAPPAGNYLFCSGGQLRIMEIREAASLADRQKWEHSPPIPHSMTKSETGHPNMFAALEMITKDNLKEGITDARLDWLSGSELFEDQQSLFMGPEYCLKLPFTTQVWLPDNSTVTVKVTGIIDGQDGVERPGTGFGFKVEYMGHELLLPVDAFVDELASPDDVEEEWLGSPAAVHAKVFAIIRDYYDNAIFTEGNIFFSIWDDVRYDLCHLKQKNERKKCLQALRKDFLNNPPAIKKICSFPEMTCLDRLNCVVLPFPLCQMSLAFHTYLSSVAKFPLELKLKYGGGVVMATGIVPYKADNCFQESRGVYVTVDLPSALSEAPPSKKRKNSSPRVVALSVHGVEACPSTPDPVRRFLEDLAALMKGEDGMCVLKTRFLSLHMLPTKVQLPKVSKGLVIQHCFLQELLSEI